MLSTALLTLTTSACMKEFSETVQDEKAGLNGSFEIGKNGKPVNWLLYTQKTTGSGNFSLMLDQNISKDGKQSLRFDVSECSAEGGWKSPGLSQELKAEPSADYVLRCWVKNQGSEFSIRFNGVSAFEKSDGPELRSAESHQDWQKIELHYKMPENMERLRMELNLLKPGTFWIDGIEIVKNDLP